MAKLLQSCRKYGQHISPSADALARILFALFGGVLLLIPLAAMAYITAKKYLVMTATLFVLFFAVTMALATVASNQELATATAAYAAVLVVFVGTNIPSSIETAAAWNFNGTNDSCPGCYVITSIHSIGKFAEIASALENGQDVFTLGQGR